MRLEKLPALESRFGEGQYQASLSYPQGQYKPIVQFFCPRRPLDTVACHQKANPLHISIKGYRSGSLKLDLNVNPFSELQTRYRLQLLFQIRV